MVELTATQKEIKKQCEAISELLVAKNQAYGNSFADPIRIFSKQSAEEQLLVRIDDKLNRMQKGSKFGTEDTILDLVGYLILLRVLRSQQRGA